MLNTRNCDPFSRSPTYSTEEDSNEAIEIALIGFNCSPVPGFDPICGTIIPISGLSFPHKSSSGRCSVLLIHPMLDGGQIFAVTFPLISAIGNGP